MIPQVLSQNNHKIKAIRALGVQKQRNSSITNMSRTISGFAEKHNAGLTVMVSGEHWFHTEDQMRFLDEWILREEHKSPFPLKNNGKKNDNENAGNMCYSIDNDKQINDQEAAVMEKNKDAKGYRQDGPGQRGDLL